MIDKHYQLYNENAIGIHWIVALYLLFISGFFGLEMYTDQRQSLVYIFCAAIVVLFMYSSHLVKELHTPFTIIVLLLLIVPWLSGITKFVMYGGVPFQKPVIMASFPWLLYYVFYHYRIGEKTLIRAFLMIGLLLFAIQLFQVLFPQYAIFGIYDEERQIREGEVSEIRNNINRYRLGGWELTLFCMYYSWQKLLEKYSFKRLLFFTAFLLSMYLHLTRQIMFSSIIALGCTLFFIKRTKVRLWVVVAFVLLSIAFLFNYEVLFSDLANKAEIELSNNDNVRWIAFEYFGGQIFTNYLTVLFGHGLYSGAARLIEMHSAYASDVGFIGEAYTYGLLWIALWLYTVWLILYKYRNDIPLYLKLFVFGSALHSWGMFPYRFASENLLWVSMLYISTLYIARAKKKRAQKKLNNLYEKGVL